ncbi:hypothetical protein QN382_10845 [Pseudomonas sp. 10B1]|uniref:hypothetical protein n=1 Tax=unclassified Pseudomonas TaxID=196821 RepID=UPI002AB516E8|nr:MULTISPECIES: hypothetical protein [unclassified Pseudomonas]MDY7560241.1 hypothetical protein [Pseudomonas sp. AB6]MEA9993871.1 hypothetical protein [Pseudomonas sp. AA4]MEB0085449.1 hypothetical protein [Pseudomonas sp. RTI1]MEB0152342.1 hypothetical protein [Pseudomonas sp. CCC4.3]MEB0178790.1 hypothetical protein [Pseudomonas sp. CCC3.2]
MERPIIFSAPMVTAILHGKKTVTRRIVKQVESASSVSPRSTQPTLSLGAEMAEATIESLPARLLHSTERCPYGRQGDVLWLKETFYAYGRWEARFNRGVNREEWRFLDTTLSSGMNYQYAQPADYLKTSRSDPRPGWWRRSNVFMPRRASRISLEITYVHKERLRDITDEQAIAEGFTALHNGTHGYFANHLPPPNAGISTTPVIAFAVFWQSLNGAESWEENPWVWVVGFRRITS